MSLEKEEFTGKDVNYYLVEVKEPKRLAPYTAECEDIIEALGMTFAEGCEFKALWRSCAARTLGKHKKGQDEHGIYDAEKQVYYAKRTLAQRIKHKEQISEVHVGTPIPFTISIVNMDKPKTSVMLNQTETEKIPKVETGLCIHKFRSNECGCTTLLHKECHKTFEDCCAFGNEHAFIRG